MIRRLFFLYILLFLLTGGTYAQNAEWKAYTAPGKDFSVMFPGTPELSDDTVSLPTGVQTMHYYISEEPDGSSYMVSSIDTKQKNVGDMKRYLESSRDGAVSGANGYELKTIKINTDKNPYIVFTFQSDTYNYQMTVYMHASIQYSVVVLNDRDKELPAGSGKFFNSFKILK